MKKVLVIALVAMIAMASVFAQGAAEGEPAAKKLDFPKRPITITVGSAAGGGTDVMARSLAESLDVGVAVNVVNKPGASGTVAASELANAKPDGYTINIGMPAATYIVPHTQKLSYTRESLRNIAVISPDEPLVFCVVPDSPIKTFEDFKALMASDKPVNLGTANPGSVGNVALNDLIMRWNSDANKSIVPFQGSAQSITALLGGHIDITVADLLEVTGRVANGTLRAIAVFGDKRADSLPDVPCMKELGVEDTGYAVAWKWVQVPADTPEEIVDYLKEAVNKAVTGEKYSAFIKQLNGLDTYSLTEEEINAKIDMCYKSFGDVLGKMTNKR